MDITMLRQLLESGSFRWSAHCLERMGERDISREDAKSCVRNGEIIEDYPEDFPYPSCLIFGGSAGERPLHAVVGTDGEFLYFITVYHPNTVKLMEDLKTRRK